MNSNIVVLTEDDIELKGHINDWGEAEYTLINPKLYQTLIGDVDLLIFKTSWFTSLFHVIKIVSTKNIILANTYTDSGENVINVRGDQINQIHLRIRGAI